MALTNRQIERYSRQLITPGFGGRAQERLLAARLLVIASAADCDSVLGYMAGAGVGEIDLCAELEPAERTRIIDRMRECNADSKLRVAATESQTGEFGNVDLILALAGDAATLDGAGRVCAPPDEFATNPAGDCGTVFARLDQSPRIAVIPRRPPCPRCAAVGNLLAPMGVRAEHAAFVVMLAVLEAIKLLACYAAPSDAKLIEFRGYASSVRPIDSVPGFACSCAAARTAVQSR